MTDEDNHRVKTSHRHFFSFFSSSSESSIEPYKHGENNIKTYVEKRFQETQKYYKKRANQYGRLYIVLQILVIGIGASIPVFNALYPNITNVLPVSSILGALIVVVSGTLGLLKVQEFWILYATTLDKLETEYELFLHGIGNDYNIEDHKDGKKKEKAFIKNLEEIIISKGSRYAALRGRGNSGRSGDEGGATEQGG